MIRILHRFSHFSEPIEAGEDSCCGTRHSAVVFLIDDAEHPILLVFEFVFADDIEEILIVGDITGLGFGKVEQGSIRLLSIESCLTKDDDLIFILTFCQERFEGLIFQICILKVKCSVVP